MIPQKHWLRNVLSTHSGMRRRKQTTLESSVENLEPKTLLTSGLGDIDDSGNVDVFTDGILTARRFAGFSGTTLTNMATDEYAFRTEPADIAAYIDTRLTELDFDSNGVNDALTDGILFARAVAGFSGNSLVDGAIDPEGTRTDPGEILTYIQDLFPTLAVGDLSPMNGERMVNVVRETIINFHGRVNPATLNSESFEIYAGSTAVPGELRVSPTGRFATYYYENPLPAQTEVTVRVDGDRVSNANGVLLDGNMDGVPGGTLEIQFSTLPLARVTGTNVFGFVRDSSTGEPLAGATIRVDAFPEANAVTDADGRFELVDMPAPDFFVHIDGSTADSPEGFTYPNVGKAFHSVPGQTVQISMDGEAFDIYLPQMANSDVQDLSASEDSSVGFGDEGVSQLSTMFPDIPAESWDDLQITIAPGTAVDDQGNAAQQAVVIPVPPDRLPAPLPPFANPQLVVSVQVPGATNFDVPAPITLPNLDGLAPGSKATLFSFNHDAGDWFAIGLGTVSDDGSVIVSDPGVGIRAPGWHYSSPPTNWTGSGGEPTQSNPANTPVEVEGRLLTSGDTDTLSFEFTPPPGAEAQEGDHTLPAGETNPTRVVRITVRNEADFNKFYNSTGSSAVKTETITLRPGDSAVTRSATLKNLQQALASINGGRALANDRLLGAVVEIDDTLTLADGSQQRTRKNFVVYYLVDQSDDSGTDDTLKLPRTVETNNVTTKRQIDIMVGAAPDPTFVFGANAGDYADDNDGFTFNPSATGNRNSTLAVEFSMEGQTVRTPDGATIEAEGTEIQRIHVNTAGLKTALSDVHVQSRITVDFTAANASDTYTLTFDGNTTGNIRFDAGAAAIESALAGLAGIGAGDVDVRFVPARGTARNYEVDFKGALAGTNKALTATNGSTTATLSVRSTVSKAEYELVDTDAERTAIANGVLAQVQALYTAETDGVTVADTAGSSTVTILWEHAPSLGGLGTSTPVGIDNATAIKSALTSQRNSTQVVRNYFLDMAMNQNLTTTVKSYVDTAFEFRNVSGLANPAQAIINTFAKTAAHEAGHSYGGRHTSTSAHSVTVNGVAGSTDIMAQGLDFTASLAFREFLSSNVLDLALNLGWTEEQGKRAWDLYTAHYRAASGGFDEVVTDPNDPNFEPGTEDEAESEAFDGRVLLAFDDNDLTVFSDITFTPVDVAAAAPHQTMTLVLTSAGEEDITIDQVSLGENADAFSISGVDNDTTLAFGESVALVIEFNPEIAGTHQTTLTVQSNDDTLPSNEFVLTGVGLSSEPAFSVNVGNNNFGGSGIGQTVSRSIEISNPGSQDLEFTPEFTSGSANFGIMGAGELQTIPAGESRIYETTFAPTQANLLQGMLTFTTNDPEQPTVVTGFVGTGIPDEGIHGEHFHWGDDFAVIEYNNFTQRVRTNAVGEFMFDVPVETEYTFRVFDPVSGLIATSMGVTGPAGAFTDLTSALAFAASVEPDLDFDRLPSDIELAIGTLANNADSDTDTVTDGNEIAQGLNPLDGFAITTGALVALDLPGNSEALAVSGDYGYVATGSHGLAIVDVSDFNIPILTGQLELDGTATDVDFDARLNRVAVAAGLSIKIVDVTDPSLPVLSQTVPHASSHVVAGNGVLYAVGGNILRTIDTISGEVLQTLPLEASGTVTDIGLDGNQLAVFIGGSDTLVMVDVSREGDAFVAGSRVVSIASSEVGLSLGGNEVWLAGSGLRSIDVSDPASPELISNADTFFSARKVARNGSGQALMLPDGESTVDVYDVSDPSVTDTLLQSFSISSTPRDVAINRGIGWVATADGIQVFNFLAVDTVGIAPEAVVSSTVTDADPDTDGIQVIEGSTIPVQVIVTDDVQVREVSVIVNGEVVSTDTSFPYNFFIEAPLADASSELNISVSALDTGNNPGTSNTLRLQLTPDVFPPEIETLTPENGDRRFVGQRNVRVQFSEPIAESALDPSVLSLIFAGDNGTFGDGDDSTVPATVQLRDDDRRLQLTSDEPMAAGMYRVSLDATQVTDRRGNALGDEFVFSDFEVRELDASAEFLPFGSDITIRTDDTSFEIAPLPFDFEFFGTSVDGNMFVTTNGVVLFNEDTLGSRFTNFDLPANHTAAFPFFDDLDPRRGENPRIGLFDSEGVRAISFFDIPHFRNNDIIVSFQIAFLSNGVIQIRYGDMDEELGDSGGATIGLSNGEQAAVPSLGNIENKPEVGITDESGRLNNDGLALLDEIFGGNDMLTFVPDDEGSYSIFHNN